MKQKSLPFKLLFASIIVTYRCNAQCHMCNTWQHPSDPKEEIDYSVYEKLPSVDTINITGGEPFLRTDLESIIQVLRKKAKRIVISSNGYYTERILRLFERHTDIGIRISLEGLPSVNDELRGIRDGFDHGLRTLLELKERGIRDIGFGITLSDKNAHDLIPLYRLARFLRVEFATAAVHNSFYFHKFDNRFEYPEIAVKELNKLIDSLLRSRRPKDWYRAFFNYGLVSYIQGKSRLLPCTMGNDSFFLDPFGNIYPCNVMQESMGTLANNNFRDIWSGESASLVRQKVATCRQNCWMMGSVGEEIKKHPLAASIWILKRKFIF